MLQLAMAAKVCERLVGLVMQYVMHLASLTMVEESIHVMAKRMFSGGSTRMKQVAVVWEAQPGCGVDSLPWDSRSLINAIADNEVMDRAT